MTDDVKTTTVASPYRVKPPRHKANVAAANTQYHLTNDNKAAAETDRPKMDEYCKMQ